MSKNSKHVGILGGGIAGLVAAYELSKVGIRVTLLEKMSRLGGLAGSFHVDSDNEIEKYYHFICKTDYSYLQMISELGIKSKLRWKTTKMGLYYDKSLYTFGDPLSLILFPHLSMLEKIRFAWTTMKIKSSNYLGWKNISKLIAFEWLNNEYGKRNFEMLYKPLINLKFRNFASELSAAWIWARIHRLGNSRSLTQKEYIGYLEGGSQLYIDALEASIQKLGGEIKLNFSVDKIVVENNQVVGVFSENELKNYDFVISTAPLPNVVYLFSDQDSPYFDNIRSLEYIGVMVMVLRINQKFSKYFWTNISEQTMNIAGLIEYTNLNPCHYLKGDSIMYIPQYLPSDHNLYLESNENLFSMYCEHLSKIQPEFDKSWVKDYWVFRNRFAQPICDIHFEQKIPDMKTPIKNFYITDSYQIQPDDRTISKSTSTDLGKKAASYIIDQIKT